MGFKTHSELNEILPEKKKVTLKQEDQEDEQESNQIQQQDDGDLSMKEYDYLLSMPMLSLTEERVEELQKLLHDKKTDYDRLFKMHIYDIWQRDLDSFLQALQEYEDQEEKDRLAIGASKGGANKKKGGRRAKPKEG